jgi:tryptophanyl-tRNA synthetase
MEKKRLLSGMQPTGGGRLHLGNYEGALKPWVQLQDQYEMYCFIADWHAYTTLNGPPEDIAAASRNVALDFISAGLDPEKCAIFRQSSVPEHAELAVLLGMITPVSWLERVPTYKEKREFVLGATTGASETTGASFGLLGYPVLQSADILVYRAHCVPVGKDQAAHLEISREIARRFNYLVGTEIFPEPDALISADTGVVPGLDVDAEGKLRKMSKSYGNCIYLTDSPDALRASLKSAFTSPLKMRKTDPGAPEGCAVCQLRRLYDPESYQIQWDECRSGERGCSQSKTETADVLIAALEPMRQRRAEYEGDIAELDRLLARGAEKARATAAATLVAVRQALRLT